MKRMNLNRADLGLEGDEPPGYEARAASIGEPIGATRLGGSVVELDPGQTAWPYHWEAAHEEWLFVLDGTVVVRTPEGEQELGRGDIVCFPCGPEGAHQVRNGSDGVARFVMVSNRAEVNAIVYPDSDKVSVSTPHESGRFRRGDGVDYWEGES